MNRLFALFDHLVRTWWDWFFRRRSPGMGLVTIGASLILGAMTGLAVKLDYRDPARSFKLDFTTDSGLGDEIILGIFGLGVLLVILGLRRLKTEFAVADRLKAIAIEIRGLRDWNGAPLVDAVPPDIQGRREPVLIDVRQRADGEVMSPELALKEVEALRPRLNSMENGLDRRDVTYVVGGLAPVPFTFLLGLLIDDEGPMRFLDWDRHSRVWKSLSDADDGRRFIVRGLDSFPGANEAILAVSASYKVDLAGAMARVNAVPVVQLDLDGASTESNWSDAKQQELARQFHNVVLQLANSGVTQIHLFLAGPSSLVLRLGATYDKRLFPALRIYQYEAGQQPPFTWALGAPVRGETASIVR